MKIFSVQEMIDAERAADAAGHSYATMMEMAGEGLANTILAETDALSWPIIILVGSGNNGGDGLIAARYMHQAGAKVSVFCNRSRDPNTDSNFKQLIDLGIETHSFEEFGTVELFDEQLVKCGVFVDALFGTGLNKPVKELYTTLLELVDSANSRDKKFIVAVDCPSGMNCDTGEIDEATLTADLTVTFGGAKHGHFLYPAAGKVGRLIAVDIGLDPLITEKIKTELATADVMRQLLPQRPANGHKGTFGKVLIAAGSNQYRGAGILSAKGAFRTGSGLVALMTPVLARQSAVGLLPEATFPPISDESKLDTASAKWLEVYIREYNAILIGPGVDRVDHFIQTTLRHMKKYATPGEGLVLDADGLNALARIADFHTHLPSDTILTPHPAEMARLLTEYQSVVTNAERIRLTKEKATEWGCIILLKGANTVVAAPDGRVVILPFANPLLAVAGSGDVLSGVIVSLLGQGLDPFDAAVLGGWLHGSAGELARHKFGDRGMLASELADLIPLAIQQLQAGDGS